MDLKWNGKDKKQNNILTGGKFFAQLVVKNNYEDIFASKPIAFWVPFEAIENKDKIKIVLSFISYEEDSYKVDEKDFEVLNLSD